MQKLFMFLAVASLYISLAGDLSAEDVKVEQLKATMGDSTSDIMIDWKCTGDCSGKIFHVYRSYLKDKNYEKIAEIEDTRYIDKNAEQGTKYWFRIAAVDKGAEQENEKNSNENEGTEEKNVLGTEEVPENSAGPVSGYRKFPKPKGLKIKKVLRAKRKKIPKRSRIQKRIDRRALKIIRPFYMNRVKFRIVMTVGLSYVKKGALVMLEDYDDYDYNLEKRTIIARKEDHFVKFYAKKIREIEKALGKLGPNKKVILDRLFRNALYFGIYRGEKEVQVSKEGKIKYIHFFEAIGMAMEYYKNYKGWKKSTIMLGSSNKKLKELMEKAQRDD